MNLEIFQGNGVQIRGGLIDGEPYFVAKDVSDALGYKDAESMTRRLDGDEKLILKELLKTYKGEDLRQMGLRYDAILINEAGLYAAILWSQKPEAKKFKRWVTHEVLPAIRKHGGYLTPEKVEEALLNPDTLIRLATDLKAERERRAKLEAMIEEQKPLVSFAKTVEASVDSVLIGTYAKLLSDAEGVKIGQNRLFEWLRENGYLIEGGARHNVPYQRYIDNGWFEVTTQTFAGTTGAHQKFTTKITGKGQIALAKKIVEAFRKEQAA